MVYAGSGTQTVVVGTGTNVIHGGAGDNTFVFPSPLAGEGQGEGSAGIATIIANPAAASNTLDFSAFTAGQGVNINLGSTAQQDVLGNVALLLTLASVGNNGDTGIDNILAGAGNNTLT